MDRLLIAAVCEFLEVEVQEVVKNSGDECTYAAIVCKDSFTMFLKVTNYGDVDRETANMRRARSVAPVPQVFQSGKIDEARYILMEYVADSVSMEDYPGALDDNVYVQLAEYVSKIRSCFRYCGDPGDNHDHYLAICRAENCTYTSSNEFMRNRLAGVGIADEPVLNLAEARLVLSHCDLWPRNVMVSNDGTRITSIVDWQTAGYYPEHYEHSLYVYYCQFEGYRYGPELHAWLTMFESRFTPAVAYLEKKIYKQVAARWAGASASQATEQIQSREFL